MWRKGYKEFRYATATEAAFAEGCKTAMVCFALVNGWCYGYYSRETKQAYFYDSITEKWIVPEGDWQQVDPVLLGADAVSWFESQ